MTTQEHGGPPRKSDQITAGTISETTRTLKTIHIINSLIHSNKEDTRMMIMTAKRYSGNRGGLKLPDICLTGEEKPQKKPHPENLSRPGIEPGPAA